MGFSNPEIVSTLSSKHNVSTQSIRRDIRNRVQWQPKLEDSDPKKNMLRAVNRLEWNYRESAFLFKTTNNDNAKLGALSQMRENVKAIAELQGLYKIAEEMPKAQEMTVRVAPIMMTYQNLTQKEEALIAEAYRIMEEKGSNKSGPEPIYMVTGNPAKLKEEVEQHGEI